MLKFLQKIIPLLFVPVITLGQISTGNPGGGELSNSYKIEKRRHKIKHYRKLEESFLNDVNDILNKCQRTHLSSRYSSISELYLTLALIGVNQEEIIPRSCTLCPDSCLKRNINHIMYNDHLIKLLRDSDFFVYYLENTYHISKKDILVIYNFFKQKRD
jgi:hypothetical protein